MKNKFQEKLEEFFATYPNEDSCILVGNGTIFTKKNKQYAQRHANDVGEELEVVFRPGNEPEKKDVEPVATIEIHTQESLSALKKDEVMAIGETMGIELPVRATKEEWITAILDKQAETSHTSDEDSKKTNEPSDETLNEE